MDERAHWQCTWSCAGALRARMDADGLCAINGGRVLGQGQGLPQVCLNAREHEHREYAARSARVDAPHTHQDSVLELVRRRREQRWRSVWPLVLLLGCEDRCQRTQHRAFSSLARRWLLVAVRVSE